MAEQVTQQQASSTPLWALASLYYEIYILTFRDIFGHDILSAQSTDRLSVLNTTFPPLWGSLTDVCGNDPTWDGFRYAVSHAKSREQGQAKCSVRASYWGIERQNGHSAATHTTVTEPGPFLDIPPHSVTSTLRKTWKKLNKHLQIHIFNCLKTHRLFRNKEVASCGKR